MSEATLTVPAEYVPILRMTLFGRLAAEGDCLETHGTPLAFPDGESAHTVGLSEPGVASQLTVEVLKDTRAVQTWAAMLLQLGWTDPVEGDAELRGAPADLAKVVGDAITDAGTMFAGGTESAPTEWDRIEKAIGLITWARATLDEFGAVAA